MKKIDIEAYFIDLDGTMIDIEDEQTFLSKENQDFLLKLQEKTPVIISTGRSPKGAVSTIMQMINAPYAVCSTGSIIIDQNQNIIKEIFIEKSTKNELINFFIDSQYYFIVNGNNQIFYDENFDWDKRQWAQRCEKLKYRDFNWKESIRQVLVFGPSIEQIIELEKFINNKWPNLSTHIVSNGYSIEITDKFATKGYGNEFVANLLNLDIKNCVHIGDSKNDLLALPQTGYLIALRNATDELKKVAFWIGQDYKNAGLAKTIAEFESIFKINKS